MGCASSKNTEPSVRVPPMPKSKLPVSVATTAGGGAPPSSSARLKSVAVSSADGGKRPQSGSVASAKEKTVSVKVARSVTASRNQCSEQSLPAPVAPPPTTQSAVLMKKPVSVAVTKVSQPPKGKAPPSAPETKAVPATANPAAAVQNGKTALGGGVLMSGLGSTTSVLSSGSGMGSSLIGPRRPAAAGAKDTDTKPQGSSTNLVMSSGLGSSAIGSVSSDSKLNDRDGGSTDAKSHVPDSKIESSAMLSDIGSAIGSPKGGPPPPGGNVTPGSRISTNSVITGRTPVTSQTSSNVEEENNKYSTMLDTNKSKVSNFSCQPPSAGQEPGAKVMAMVKPANFTTGGRIPSSIGRIQSDDRQLFASRIASTVSANDSRTGFKSAIDMAVSKMFQSDSVSKTHSGSNVSAVASTGGGGGGGGPKVQDSKLVAATSSKAATSGGTSKSESSSSTGGKKSSSVVESSTSSTMMAVGKKQESTTQESQPKPKA